MIQEHSYEHHSKQRLIFAEKNLLTITYKKQGSITLTTKINEKKYVKVDSARKCVVIFL
jgi:hypothetical protein